VAALRRTVAALRRAVAAVMAVLLLLTDRALGAVTRVTHWREHPREAFLAAQVAIATLLGLNGWMWLVNKLDGWMW
jgi:hypothetical protein